MNYAIFKTKGKQFKVSKGDKIVIDNFDFGKEKEGDNNNNEGKEINFDEVLLVRNEGNVDIGKPTIKNASVSAKVIRSLRDKKIIAFKFKRRQGFHKSRGHRRQLVELEITNINV